MRDIDTGLGEQMIAEGIETAEGLACLWGVGVHHGQGYNFLDVQAVWNRY